MTRSGPGAPSLRSRLGAGLRSNIGRGGRLRSCRTAQWAVLAMFAVLAAVAWASPARAHASLVATSPTDRSELATAPDRVEFAFNEDITVAPGGLRVFDGDGQRVDDSQQVQTTADMVAVGVPDLADGGYLATYLVTSADGHVIRGAVTFQVGSGAALDDDTVAAMFASGEGSVVSWLVRLNSGVQMGAALIALGALVPILRRRRGATGTPTVASLTGGARAATDPEQTSESPPMGQTDEMSATGALGAAGTSSDAGIAQLQTQVAGSTMLTAALWGTGAALVGIGLQSIAVSGQGIAALGSVQILGEVVASTTGLANLTLIAGLLGMYGGLRGTPRLEQVGFSAILAAASFLLVGHTMTVEPALVMLVADFVHVAAAGVWAGGLVVVVRTWRRAGKDADATGLAAVVADFSGTAVWALAGVVVAGSALTWALARHPRALVSTDWGWTWVVKVGLVAVVLAIAAYNRWRLVPLVDRAGSDGVTARSQLSSTMRAEVSILVLILATTAVLSGLRPAAAEAGITGAFDTVVALDEELSVNLVVDPNRAGANQIHLYLVDDTGRPVDDIEEVTLELTQVERDLGPIVRTPAPTGPGHWILAGNELAIPGAWRITTVVGVDRFTEQRVDIDVIVNPS